MPAVAKTNLVEDEADYWLQHGPSALPHTLLYFSYTHSIDSASLA